MKRKSMILAIATSLALSTASFGAPAPTAATQLAKQIPTIQLQKPAPKMPARLVTPENPSEKVRIIVELEKAPAIETATQKGVLYKELPESQRTSLEAAIEKDQVNVRANISRFARNMKVKENFTAVFNGFSAEVDAKDVARIASTTGVKAVHESTEYDRPLEEPNMTHSAGLVQAQLAWEKYNFKGEGMVVGVIDTGIDSTHRDMVLTNDASGDITSTRVNKLINKGAIEPGKYFTAKVPFGYNYMDGNQEIRDLGPGASMHGMHVGGTVAANGDEENGGIKGVAPEAQLLALKVFGNDPLFPSTYGDIYVKAMDDAIKLGADVLNMSLGSTAGYVDNSSPEQQAVSRAQDNGLLVAISAGNSDMFGSGTFYPMANNQDYGLTGSPSTSEDSFGVASFENSHITASSFSYEFDGAEAGKALFLLANDAEPNDLPLEEYPVVFAGFGTPADFAGKDLSGKIALVSRGSIPFVEKGLNAQAAGAAAVIVYNNAAGTISMASSSEITIPYMSTLQVDGLAMKAGLDSGKVVTVGFNGEYIETASPTAGKMSTFTSWGPTPNLDFKPEITAPGGNIFSTFNNNEYGLMSGTSMAAPHVAGGTALVMERVNEQFKLTGAKRVQFVKNLMMNTAKPVVLAEYGGMKEYVSPRRQGAGIMQIANALETDVMVTNKATGEAKVALKEIKDGKFTFTLRAKNYSWEKKNFDVNVQLQTDYALTTGGYDVVVPNIAGSNIVTDLVDVQAPSKITIPGNGAVDIQVSVDASALKDMEGFETFVNGFFIDGFVSLTDPNEETTGNVPLHVPFFGFNGSWDDASIFDDFLWNDDTYWGYQALADEQGNFISGPSLGEDFDPSKFAFSPNADGSIDKAIPVYSLMRNAKKFEVNVLDANGNKLRTIRTASNLTKDYIDSATNPAYTYSAANGWDGKVNYRQVADGQYQIQLRAVIDFEGAEWQEIKYPIMVDTKVPTADVSFDASTKTLAFASVADNAGGVGIDRVEVLVNGKEVKEAATLESYVVASAMPGDDITVKVWDIAGNKVEQKFTLQNVAETVEPVIFITTPDFFGYHNSSEVLVSGTVEDDSDIKSLKINGEVASSFDGKTFKHTLVMADGVQNVSVEAIDEFDNKMSIARKVFVDSTKPTVKAVANTVPTSVKANVASKVIKVRVGDNFDEIRLYLNGSEVFAKEISEPYRMSNFSQVVEVELPLEVGKNDFELKVVDLVGHEATQNISVTRQGAAKPAAAPAPIKRPK
ncbi:S8 family serine peptidase [Paenisporosarcina sp. NPDC076898]|uniref:S8 family serine peptidase n=1 Tax=unclassified Paenisporosarcina TaxID=2642018 RepID=UPI003D0141AE